MPAATRLLVAFLVLIGAFLALVGVAVASLYAAGQQALAMVVAIAGCAGVGAGAFTYWLLRRDVVEEDGPEILIFDEAPAVMQPVISRAPLRVQSRPVADLPQAYVDAVLRGAQARLNAMKADAKYPSGAESR